MAGNIIPERIFENMGITMNIVTGNTKKEFKAILQPLRYKNKIYLNGVPTELGYDSLKKYLLLCSCNIDLESIDGFEKQLFFDSKRFRVDHCEKVYFKQEPFYYWAIVHKEDKP